MFKKIFILVSLVITIVALVMALDSMIGWYMGLPKGLYFKTDGIERNPISSHFMMVMYFYFIYMWIGEIKINFKKK